MPEFSYEALNEADQPTSGRESAENVSAAIAQLEAQGLRVTSIQQIDVEPAAPREAVDSPAVDSPAVAPSAESDDQQALRQRVAEVLENRDVLVPALSAFAEEMPRGRSRRQLRKLVANLREGASVEELCGSDDPITTWLPLLSGRGRPQRMLSDLFVEASRENENRTQRVRVLLYPSFVFLAALIVFIFLCIAVVPTFKNIFRDFGFELPSLTVGVIELSDMIVQHPVELVLGVLAGAVTLYLLFRLFSAWGLFGRVWNVLATGNSRQVTATAQFTRRLAEALEAGMALPTALRLAGSTEGRSRTRQIALQLAHAAEQENYDLKESPWARRLPATVVHAMQAGPDGKPNIVLLQQLAELYTERVRDRYDWSTGFLSQFAIIVLGLTVGVVMFSLLMPLVDLITKLSG